MKLSSRHIVISSALLACLAPLSLSAAGCSVKLTPVPDAIFADDGGTGAGRSDAGPSAESDAAPAPNPSASDGSTPQPAALDPALAGTWRANDTLDNMKNGYGSFSLDATLDASGTLAIATSGVRTASSLLDGCTEKYTASGSYTVKGSSIVSSGVPTGGDVFGKINRTGCTNPTDNVTDGTMTDTIRGSLFNSVAGPYVVAGSTLTITTSTGVALTFAKQ